MWWTSQGERVLEGPEAELVRAAAESMRDVLSEDWDQPDEDRWEWGVSLFDDLSQEQQVALLAATTTALLDPAVPRPRLTAVTEASVAALYKAAEQGVEWEVDVEEDMRQYGRSDPQTVYFWRQRIRDCFDEDAFAGIDEELIPVESADIGEWRELVGLLADRVLWDDDWSDAGLFLDVDPEVGRQLKREMRIEDDYYTAIAPEPTAAELERAWEALWAIRDE